MKKTIAMGLLALGLAIGLAVPIAAQAQATRTWVSGVGDDANPCSRTAPCKTFAGAISKTAAGGEINVLDPGGFGAVTITKSITILADGDVAGIAAPGTNGIIINAAATDVIVLKGLDIDGYGNTSLNGVKFINGGALHIYNCIIRNFKGGLPNGFGVMFSPNSASELYISDTIISGNGSAGWGAGVLIGPQGTGNANVTINNSNIDNNEKGVWAYGNDSTTAMNITIQDSVVHGNGGDGVLASTIAGKSRIQINLDRTSVTGNVGTGAKADGAAASGSGSATVRIGSSVISSNVQGVSAVNAGVIQSYKNNSIAGNVTDGTPITQIPLN